MRDRRDGAFGMMGGGPSESDQVTGNPREPRAVLGIDAAWTETQPSGVALAVETEGEWRLDAAEASHGHFIARAYDVEPGEARPLGSKPDAAALLEAARKICRRRVDLVAVDMPLSRRPIAGRRFSDDEVSGRYGARGAGTHSPSGERPGKVSDLLRETFEQLGFGLCTRPPACGLIEVYPHTALIEFLEEPRRLPLQGGQDPRLLARLDRRRRPQGEIADNLVPYRRGAGAAYRGRRGGAAIARAGLARLAPQGL